MSPAPEDTDEYRNIDEVATDVADFWEHHPLTVLFGNSARIRIIGALLKERGPMNPASIATEADIERTTWYDHRDDLLATGLIVKAGQAGNSPLYRLADPERDDIADGDHRAEWLDKVVDYTSSALYTSSDQ